MKSLLNLTKMQNLAVPELNLQQPGDEIVGQVLLGFLLSLAQNSCITRGILLLTFKGLLYVLKEVFLFVLFWKAYKSARLNTEAYPWHKGHIARFQSLMLKYENIKLFWSDVQNF